MFFDHKLYPSMERLIRSDSTVPQLWNPITLRNPKDGDDSFSKTSVRTRPTGYKVPKGIYNLSDIAYIVARLLATSYRPISLPADFRP
jgi:hypothetical protein